MAATRFQPELRKPTSSPRPKGREHAKDTLCRNVLIYGHCRYEDQGCAFSHDPNKNASTQPDPKKSLNVDSPAFNPQLPAAPKTSSFTSQLAAAASSFTPRHASGAVTPVPQQEPELEPQMFNPAEIKDFIPGDYGFSQDVTNGVTYDSQQYADPFSMGPMTQVINETQYNALQDTTNIPTNGVGYQQFPNQYSQSAPTALFPNYHLYAPIGPHREDLLPYQKHVHYFFMPEKIREDLQRKTAATLQTIPNSNLPLAVGQYHTLLPLIDTNAQVKTAPSLGYLGWVYRATSSKNGKAYCLRRLHEYRLTNESAIRQILPWKKIDHPNIASVIEAFTTHEFSRDGSLIFVTDYFPLAKTLTDHHSPATNRYGRPVSTAVQESVLWSYIVQIASALKCVHAAGLAIRCLDPGKIILTDKNRIRLSACAVLDVLKFDEQRPLAEIQRDDLTNLGRLILGLGINDLTPRMAASNASIELFGRTYHEELRNVVSWLVSPEDTPGAKNVDYLLINIMPHIMSTMDSAQHAVDAQNSELARELENGRLVRLMAKLNSIIDRPEHATDREWGTHGKYYILSLFRDYIFHQIDAEGKPVLDLGHMIRCMNKLDAASEEKVRLSSRDEQSVYVVTYKELNTRVASAFADLQKGQRRY
ncbi:PAB-dependent poly(A)-specific ribonuclease subunit PAN3 [Calycina marina]|uniref:PAN2-PAN3 deadenylation complex subunit PAN3 n=1 Tax=Calycina marina TaxID=1763456 RepID=A0A9P7Z105_9HELO|nr:PAB-dependent poly(A)-specific ribonuclease subunit PAN3 [Calycina marina]